MESARVLFERGSTRQQDAHNVGAAAVQLALSVEKQGASTPQVSYGLKGELYKSKSDWILMQVPNALARGAFEALNEPGIELPPSGPDEHFNAHVSVMRPEELEDVEGGASAITERGQSFSYTLGPVRTVTPHGWDGMSKVWFIEVRSPELEKLRKSYGLSGLPKNGEFKFHISIAVRKKNVLGPNSTRKAASLMHGASAAFAKDGSALDYALPTMLGATVGGAGGALYSALTDASQGKSTMTRNAILGAVLGGGVGASTLGRHMSTTGNKLRGELKARHQQARDAMEQNDNEMRDAMNERVRLFREKQSAEPSPAQGITKLIGSAIGLRTEADEKEDDLKERAVKRNLRERDARREAAKRDKSRRTPAATAFFKQAEVYVGKKTGIDPEEVKTEVARLQDIGVAPGKDQPEFDVEIGDRSWRRNYRQLSRTGYSGHAKWRPEHWPTWLSTAMGTRGETERYGPHANPLRDSVGISKSHYKNWRWVLAHELAHIKDKTIGQRDAQLTPALQSRRTRDASDKADAKYDLAAPRSGTTMMDREFYANLAERIARRRGDGAGSPMHLATYLAHLPLGTEGEVDEYVEPDKNWRKNIGAAWQKRSPDRLRALRRALAQIHSDVPDGERIDMSGIASPKFPEGMKGYVDLSRRIRNLEYARYLVAKAKLAGMRAAPAAKTAGLPSMAPPPPVVKMASMNYNVAPSGIHGKGVFANRTFATGDRIGVSLIFNRESNGKTYYDRTPLGRFINWSATDNPNTTLERDGENWVQVASENIASAEELTASKDYREEYQQLGYPFKADFTLNYKTAAARRFYTAAMKTHTNQVLAGSAPVYNPIESLLFEGTR